MVDWITIVGLEESPPSPEGIPSDGGAGGAWGGGGSEKNLLSKRRVS